MHLRTISQMRSPETFETSDMVTADMLAVLSLSRTFADGNNALLHQNSWWVYYVIGAKAPSPPPKSGSRCGHTHPKLAGLRQSPSTFSPHRNSRQTHVYLCTRMIDQGRNHGCRQVSHPVRALRVCIGLSRRRPRLSHVKDRRLTSISSTGTRDFPKERRVSRREPRIPSPEKIGTQSRRHPPSTRESMSKFRIAQRRDQQTNNTFFSQCRQDSRKPNYRSEIRQRCPQGPNL